jgi:hypothetical protein
MTRAMMLSITDLRIGFFVGSSHAKSYASSKRTIMSVFGESYGSIIGGLIKIWSPSSKACIVTATQVWISIRDLRKFQ